MGALHDNCCSRSTKCDGFCVRLLQMTLDPDAQVRYYDECAPNATADSNVMCLEHVVPHGAFELDPWPAAAAPWSQHAEIASGFGLCAVTSRALLPPAGAGLQSNVIEFDQTAFLLGNFQAGFMPTAWAYIPTRCRLPAAGGGASKAVTACSMMVFFHGCGGGGA